MKDTAIPSDALVRFRAAAAEYAGGAKPRVSRLEAVRDEIAAMRSRGASFRTISELLSRCGIRASDTCVMRFCRSTLGERPHPRSPATLRAASNKNRRAAPPAKEAASSTVKPSATEEERVSLLDDLLSLPPPAAPEPTAHGGPRIAKIQFAKSDES